MCFCWIRSFSAKLTQQNCRKCKILKSKVFNRLKNAYKTNGTLQQRLRIDCTPHNYSQINNLLGDLRRGCKFCHSGNWPFLWQPGFLVSPEASEVYFQYKKKRKKENARLWDCSHVWLLDAPSCLRRLRGGACKQEEHAYIK